MKKRKDVIVLKLFFFEFFSVNKFYQSTRTTLEGDTHFGVYNVRLLWYIAICLFYILYTICTSRKIKLTKLYWDERIAQEDNIFLNFYSPFQCRVIVSDKFLKIIIIALSKRNREQKPISLLEVCLLSNSHSHWTNHDILWRRRKFWINLRENS